MAIAAIVGAYVGMRGLDTWRRQLRGNTEYILAKDLLAASFSLRDAIAAFRHPILEHSAEPDLPPQKLATMSVQDKGWHALAQAYERRWQAISKSLTALDALCFEAEAVWGQPIVRKVSALRRLVGELDYAIRYDLDHRRPGTQPDVDKQEQKRVREVVFARFGTDHDEFNQSVATAIHDIQDELRPHVWQHHN